MYSNALKQYRYFISLVTDEIGDNAYIESIVRDRKQKEKRSSNHESDKVCFGRHFLINTMDAVSLLV